MADKLTIRTQSRVEMIDITAKVQDIVARSGVTSGVCTIYVPHTTAAVTINENADISVTEDIMDRLEKIVPYNVAYRHGEGNADAHIKASLVGFSESVFVEDSELALGTWQGIFFCEFDGPRTRQVFVRVNK